MRLMSHETQHPDRGTAIRISRDGKYEIIADGLRQANGIGISPEGEIFLTENQGQWVPANKVIHLREGEFHGCQFGTGDKYAGREMTPPTVWLPQDEIGNSPSQPVLMQDEPYRGQLLHGEVTHGGIKRVFLEEVDGAYQGCVFRFTQGLEAGVNRLVWGPDGKLYVGGIGMVGNWGWQGRQYGLQALAYNEKSTFEMLAVRAMPDGLEVEFTEPLAEGQGEKPADYPIEQWRYEVTPAYGGPKLDLESLPVSRVELSQDRRKARLYVQGCKERHVLHLQLSPALHSASGQTLWSGDCWYTMNAIPQEEIQ
jgi:cytochrome c